MKLEIPLEYLQRLKWEHEKHVERFDKDKIRLDKYQPKCRDLEGVWTGLKPNFFH